jgi:hypothetical protein
VSISHTFSLGHAGGSVPLSDTVTVAGTVAVEINVTVNAAATNQLVPISYVAANVKGVYVRSDQDVTVKVDSTGSPEQTVALKANVPYVWYTGDPSPLLFATDCSTGWYVTNAGASAANVYARILN